MSSPTTELAAGPAPGALKDDAAVIGLVGAGHMLSHYSQLLLAPLFPWLKAEFNVSYTELGFLMTVFFVMSCAVQTSSGFMVDRFGPRPILFAGLALLACAAFGFASSTSYWMLMFFSVIGGVGNGVFHPADYTLINRKVSPGRLGHAYSVHGITGSLGWALAPVMLVPLAIAYSWRVALVGAGCLFLLVLALLVIYRARLHLPPLQVAPQQGEAKREGSFDFLAIPAVWMCFGFFFFYSAALSAVQTFAPEAAGKLHSVPPTLVAICLTTYMLAAAGGMVLGGFLISNPERCERIVGFGFGVIVCISLLIGFGSLPVWMVPVLFGVMGFAAGSSSPSRDMLVKRSAPPNASGRVYGVVYSGLDIGQALMPLIFGAMMDKGRYQAVWVVLALTQAVLIVSAFNVRKVRRTPLPATA
ncbi:MFS transporter [Ottowia thiooxydans]|uniref:MFS transporter n=1 Tax=Ottowia thiooxydans TaxID=219182 RepID=UPI001B7F820B|nr:MFS transporter [Ottowia thiooxydans]